MLKFIENDVAYSKDKTKLFKIKQEYMIYDYRFNNCTDLSDFGYYIVKCVNSNREKNNEILCYEVNKNKNVCELRFKYFNFN